MAMVNLRCRLVSRYGKDWLASRTANAIVFIRNDHILKANVKSEPLGVMMRPYGLLSCCVQNFSSRAISKEKDKVLENAGSKEGVSSKEGIISNEVHEDEEEYEDDEYLYMDVNYLDAAKFAVEQHNLKNGTQLKILELGKSRLSPFDIHPKHVAYVYLYLKVIDEKGKVEYVKADMTYHRDSLESAPLVYLTNQMLRNNNTSISQCFSDDGNTPSVEQPDQSGKSR